MHVQTAICCLCAGCSGLLLPLLNKGMSEKLTLSVGSTPPVLSKCQLGAHASSNGREFAPDFWMQHWLLLLP